MLKRDQPSDVCHKYEDDWSQRQFIEQIKKSQNYNFFLTKDQIEKSLLLQKQMMKTIKIVFGVSILSAMFRKKIPIIGTFSSLKARFIISNIFIWVPAFFLTTIYIQKLKLNQRSCYIQQKEVFRNYIITGDAIQMNPDIRILEQM